ncbi:MAG: hypothetical protein LBB34_00550 [Holosporales bacterium]|nr:hypothetical protein [Holosporales bacterium]
MSSNSDKSKFIRLEYRRLKIGSNVSVPLNEMRQEFEIPDDVALVNAVLMEESGICIGDKYSFIIYLHVIGSRESILQWEDRVFIDCDREFFRLSLTQVGGECAFKRFSDIEL